MADRILAYIPSPPANGISIGPLRLHVYGLLIAVAILVAVYVAQRQYSKWGGADGVMSTLAIWGVPGGLIGARVYSLLTSWQIDTHGHVLWAFEIWKGGLGIWGGVIGGVATGLYGAHRHGWTFRPLLDAVAPALAFAQAVGRWGNYFNQELYGRRTTLPWGLHIDGMPGHYHPTFLYECIWDILVGCFILWGTGRIKLRRGFLFALYAATYTFGRFFTEYLRIDPAHRYLGLRLNDWSSIIVCVGATTVLLIWGRPKPGDDLAGAPLPAASAPGAGLDSSSADTSASSTGDGSAASSPDAGSSPGADAVHGDTSPSAPG